MAKRRFWSAVAMLLLLVLIPCSVVRAEPVTYAQPAAFDVETLSGQYAMLFDLDSGTVLVSKNTGMRVYPASTTKIMTCILALENGTLSDVVTMGEEILQISDDSSTADLSVSEQMTLEDLLYGLMLSSGNDAANAIAVYIAGSVDAFVNMMNEKAAALGMSGTHYVNPHGLHDEQHYTTVADMQILLRHAYENETFRNIVSQVSHTVAPTNTAPEGHEYKNSNLLLHSEYSTYYYQYATGAKTGYTSAAGYCLVATAEKDGLRLGALVYAGGEYERYADAAKLFFYGFENYELFDAAQLFSSRAPMTIQVEGASSQDVAGGQLSLVTVPDEDSAYMELSANVEIIRAHADEVELVLDPAQPSVQAPVTQGQQICRYSYVLDGKTLSAGTLVASRDVAERAPLFQWKAQDAETQAEAFRWILYPLVGILAIVCILLLVHSAFLRQSRRNKRRRAQDRARPRPPLVMGERYQDTRRTGRRR
jgi:D-alanyl-D-alanine carboxypeptidase (penicillin-binding protein 5/6)